MHREYEHTEDKLETHKKNNVITVGAVSEHPTQAAQKPPKQTALVCEHCEQPGHQAHTCIMPVEKLPTHKIPKWYPDKLNKKQNKSKGGCGPQGGQGNNQHGGYGNPPCNRHHNPMYIHTQCIQHLSHRLLDLGNHHHLMLDPSSLMVLLVDNLTTKEHSYLPPLFHPSFIQTPNTLT